MDTDALLNGYVKSQGIMAGTYIPRPDETWGEPIRDPSISSQQLRQDKENREKSLGFYYCSWQDNENKKAYFSQVLPLQPLYTHFNKSKNPVRYAYEEFENHIRELSPYTEATKIDSDCHDMQDFDTMDKAKKDKNEEISLLKPLGFRIMYVALSSYQEQ